jgi:hypothetical protein
VIGAVGANCDLPRSCEMRDDRQTDSFGHADVLLTRRSQPVMVGIEAGGDADAGRVD